VGVLAGVEKSTLDFVEDAQLPIGFGFEKNVVDDTERRSDPHCLVVVAIVAVVVDECVVVDDNGVVVVSVVDDGVGDDYNGVDVAAQGAVEPVV